jgi:hypothetical protein
MKMLIQMHGINNFKIVNEHHCSVTTSLPDEGDAVGLSNVALSLRSGRWPAKIASVLFAVKVSNVVFNMYTFESHVRCVHPYVGLVLLHSRTSLQ